MMFSPFLIKKSKNTWYVGTYVKFRERRTSEHRSRQTAAHSSPDFCILCTGGMPVQGVLLLLYCCCCPLLYPKRFRDGSPLQTAGTPLSPKYHLLVPRTYHTSEQIEYEDVYTCMRTSMMRHWTLTGCTLTRYTRYHVPDIYWYEHVILVLLTGIYRYTRDLGTRQTNNPCWSKAFFVCSKATCGKQQTAVVRGVEHVLVLVLQFGGGGTLHVAPVVLYLIPGTVQQYSDTCWRPNVCSISACSMQHHVENETGT